MYTAQNLTQAIDQLKRDMQKELSELNAKEASLRSLGVEKQNMAKEIQVKEAEVKQKETELQKLKLDIQQMKNKIPEMERNHRRLSDEVTKVRLEHDKKNLEMIRIQGDYAKALKDSTKK
jgi:chromosome segregation ATPase